MLSRGGRGRGTARDPGSNLHKLPIGLDLGGISIAEGLRAVLACSVFLVLNQWIGSVPLLIAATGAMITCFCDTGGTLRQRLPMLLSFTVLGASTWALFGLLRGLGDAFVLPVVAVTIFLFSMARVWGLRPQTVGNVLIVVLALAIDAPLTPAGALLFFFCFMAGGLWASLLTLVIWRIQSDRPSARAVADVWGRLAAMAADMRGLLLEPNTMPADWEAHARAHRRALRVGIEEARGVVSSSLRSRGLVSGRGTQALLLLETADQLFGEMIILSELLEVDDKPAERARAERLLRRLRPIFLAFGADAAPDPRRISRSLDRIAGVSRSPLLERLTGLIVDRLRVAVRVLEGFDQPELRAGPVRPDQAWLSRLWGPLRDELTWRSAILRHAVRATVLTVPAVAITLVWWTPYSHWLTITVALTMQPFFAATWQRALERIGGTLLGAIIGAALAFFPQTPLVTGALLLPLSIIGFSVRQVSYGAYVACLTPMVVLLFDIVEPGHSAWMVAAMRLIYTLLGGVVAVAACMVLWPSWEPDRLRAELRQTLLAYAGLSAAVLANSSTERDGNTEAARRAAGLANSNLEACLSQALQEPGRHGALNTIIAADAILRRLGAAMLAIPHDSALIGSLSDQGRAQWRAWLEAAFQATADGRPVPIPSPDAPEASTLQRVRRGLELLNDDLRQSRPAA